MRLSLALTAFLRRSASVCLCCAGKALLQGLKVDLAQVVGDAASRMRAPAGLIQDAIGQGFDRLVRTSSTWPMSSSMSTAGVEAADLGGQDDEGAARGAKLAGAGVGQDGLEELVDGAGVGQELGFGLVVDDESVDGVVHQGDALEALGVRGWAARSTPRSAQKASASSMAACELARPGPPCPGPAPRPPRCWPPGPVP